MANEMIDRMITDFLKGLHRKLKENNGEGDSISFTEDRINETGKVVRYKVDYDRYTGSVKIEAMIFPVAEEMAKEFDEQIERDIHKFRHELE